jgi:hypothetical protein
MFATAAVGFGSSYGALTGTSRIVPSGAISTAMRAPAKALAVYCVLRLFKVPAEKLWRPERP